MIFKEIRNGRPYPEHGFSMKDWAQLPLRQVRLADLVTTATVVELDRLLSEDPTPFGGRPGRQGHLPHDCLQ